MKGNGFDSNSLKFIFKEIPDQGSMVFRTFHWNLQIRRGATLIPFNKTAANKKNSLSKSTMNWEYASCLDIPVFISAST